LHCCPGFVADGQLLHPCVVALSREAFSLDGVLHFVIDREAVKVSVVQEGYLPFLIQVADITMSDARITVYPEEEGMYIAAVDFAEGFDEQKIAAENKAIFAEHAAAEQKTLAEFIAGYAYKGEQTFHPSRLSPKSDYVVYAYGVDAEGNATTDVIVEPFASLPVEPGPKIDCTISITTANLHLLDCRRDFQTDRSDGDLFLYDGR